jgi:hypothetical protein
MLRSIYFECKDLFVYLENARKWFQGRIVCLLFVMKQWCDNFQVASIIFLDAPVGTGFSYATTSQGYNITDHISAAQTYEFLTKVSENSIKIM